MNEMLTKLTTTRSDAKKNGDTQTAADTDAQIQQLIAEREELADKLKSTIDKNYGAPKAQIQSIGR
jgi:hypothetical protein